MAHTTRRHRASDVTLVAYRYTRCGTVRHEHHDATGLWHQCRPLDRHQTALAKIPDVDVVGSTQEKAQAT